MNELTESFLLLYVNSIEKWTEVKNNGLKIPEKDQMYYYSTKIIGRSFK